AIADLARDDMAEAVEDAFRYDKMILMAATYDGGVFPCMDHFIHHLKSKNYQKRKVGFVENGSWAPMAAKQMKSVIETLKDIDICEPVISIRSAMKDSDIKNMEKLADTILS
ncbi:MAG: FprA family A-type flavoprotein, partial [Clostridiales bacterium]|nr:FprA family A-type flavoprotein [Clostridiales bacterium]